MHVVMNTLVNGFVGSLTRAVSFGVVCRGEFDFDSSQFVQRTPEFRDKEFVLIRDDVFQETIFAVPVIEEQDREILRGYVSACWYDSDVRSKVICH